MTSTFSRLSCYSIAGQYHQENQDAIVVEKVQNAVLLLICDGVSSSTLGGWAAKACAQHIKEYFIQNSGLSFDTFQDALMEIDWEFRGKKRGEAACTITVVSINHDEGWFASLGDSPIVLLNETSANYKVETDDSTGLRAYVGMGNAMIKCIEYQTLSLHSGDWLLVLSDGVSNALSLEQLRQYYPHRTQVDIAKTLCSFAYEVDSGDDLSIISLAYEE